MTDAPIAPIPVFVQNFDSMPTAKVDIPQARKTTFKTYIIDPAGAAGPVFQQICDYEPGRVRLVIQVIDASISITTEPPIAKPDASTASTAPQGRYLAASTGFEYCFYGADAFWLNSLGTITRVTVTKEYK